MRRLTASLKAGCRGSTCRRTIGCLCEMAFLRAPAQQVSNQTDLLFGIWHALSASPKPVSFSDRQCGEPPDSV